MVIWPAFKDQKPMLSPLSVRNSKSQLVMVRRLDTYEVIEL